MYSRLAFIALAYFALSVRAGEPKNSVLPKSGDEKIVQTALALYEGVRQETLPNGLRVFLKPIPGSPVVSTLVAYNVGSADEELAHTGLSHYLEHLMFKGTEKLVPGDIDRMTQRNGGQNNANTSEDVTVFEFDFAADRWKTALEIEADRMRNLRIDTKHEFEQEKGAVISELDMYEDQPWDLEMKVLLPLLYGETAPYGHPVIGEKAHVRDVTAEIIKKHYDRWYHPNNAVLVIAGGFDEKDAWETIQKLFGPIPKGVLPARRPVPVHKPREETVRKKFDSKFPTPRLLFGFNTVDERNADAVPLDVLAAILTNGKTSRLHKRLIETDGTATLIQAANTSGRYPGWFSIQAELFKASEMKQVEEAIFAEIKKLAEAGPTEAELKRVRRAMAAAHIFSHEDVHELADTIARGVVANDMNFVRGYLPKLIQVTKDDVRRVAKKFLIEQQPVLIESIPKEGAAGAGENPKPKMRQLDRDVPKKSGANFDLKDAKSVVLENGLKLLLLENHRLPIVVVEANVARVKLHEPADQVGIASLMGPLLEEGTTTRTGPQIALAIEDSGGALSMGAAGGSLKVLSDDLELGLDLLFDCLMNPEFHKDDLESKRDQLLSQLAEEEQQADQRAMRAFKAAIYGQHPFGRPAAKSSVIKKLTRADVKKFHRKVFVPNNTVVAIAGDFDSEKIVEGIKKRTAEWKTKFLALPERKAPPVPQSSQLVISEPAAAQLTVYLGHIGITRTNPDYYKLLVMDYILGTGTGFTDRLSSTLRDRQGLAYSVSAKITGNAGEEPGTFTAAIGTFPDKFQEVKAGFLKEIKRIREEVPSKEEVEDVKKYLMGIQAFSITTCGEAADMLLAIDRYKLGLDYLQDYRKAIESVTPEEVRAVAKKYLDPEKLVLVAAGPIDAEGKPLPAKKKE
ncbi:MAG: insulinase family protein [Gemmataceae bacterium]|nr:insulinase family protein [Gemmataceae bacterium]